MPLKVTRRKDRGTLQIEGWIEFPDGSRQRIRKAPQSTDLKLAREEAAALEARLLRHTVDRLTAVPGIVGAVAGRTSEASPVTKGGRRKDNWGFIAIGVRVAAPLGVGRVGHHRQQHTPGSC